MLCGGPVPEPCPTTALEVALSKRTPACLRRKLRGSPPRMMRHARRSGERRSEKFDGAAPGEIGCFLVVAGFGGVVVEGVIGAFINVNPVFDPGRLKRLLERRDACVDPLIEAGIVKEQLCLDLRHVRQVWNAAVIGDGGGKIGRVDGEAIDYTTTPAEADGPNLAVRGGMLLQIGDGCHRIGNCLDRIELADHVAGLILIGRRSARGCEKVRSKREKAIERETASDVADMRI